MRESAVKIAGYFGYASCTVAILDRCRDTDETVRAAALEHVAYLDDDRSVRILVTAMATDTPRARAAAAQALAHTESSDALEALRRGVGDLDQWVRYFSVISLGRRADHASLPLLERVAAEDGAPQVRIAAVGAIGEIDRRATMWRCRCSQASSRGPMTAGSGGGARLGSVEVASAVDVLRRAMSARQPERRAAAVEAIARHGGASAVELLQWTAAADAAPDVTRAALAGLGRIGAGATPQAAAAVMAIAAVAGDPARRTDAIGVLARMPEAAIPHVGAALASRERRCVER